MCVSSGGAGSDSRQCGSVMAGYWIRLQPVRPVQCAALFPAACPAHICSRGPSCLQDHNHDKNTPTKKTHRSTEVHTHRAQAGKRAAIHLTRIQKQTRQENRLATNTSSPSLLSFFFLFPLHQPFLYHNCSQMAAGLSCKRGSITALSLRQKQGSQTREGCYNQRCR